MDSNRILMENGFRFYYADVIITVARLAALQANTPQYSSRSRHPDNRTLLSAATSTIDNPAIVRGS